jgi:hypothetical protein
MIGQNDPVSLIDGPVAIGLVVGILLAVRLVRRFTAARGHRRMLRQNRRPGRIASPSAGPIDQPLGGQATVFPVLHPGQAEGHCPRNWA